MLDLPEERLDIVQFGTVGRQVEQVDALGTAPTPIHLLEILAGLAGTRIESYLFRDLCNRSEPLEVLKDRAERGDLGAKTGQGFYDWTQRDAAQVKANRDAFLMARLRDLYPPRDSRG